jgi:PhoPQ-activated pathogenicity-related protein
LIGYAWAQFLETGDATWLPRLPMVKSAVRAMDCITEFAASDAGGNRVVEKFVIGGGSKRGWTTWMTGVADPRVTAVVPIVIDVVNAGPSLRHHAEAYGFWSEAIGNYYQHKILQRFDHPRMQELYEIVDPYYHVDQLTEPKYIVNGSGDQFFLPDSSRFYYDQLKGEKLLRYVPNADHGLKGSDAIQSIAAFYHLISTDSPRPEYDWTFEDDGSIRATSKTKPTQVMFWQAYNSDARDFRLKTIGAAFNGVELQPTADGDYVSPVPSDKPGWTASFIEFTYDVGSAFPLKVTTAVRVTPDTLPFEGIDPTTTGYEPGAQKVKITSGN